MSTINETTPKYADHLESKEAIYFCEQHGPMNKLTDLKEKTDQISRKAEAPSASEPFREDDSDRQRN
jgi:hypothetical protein